MTDDPMARPTPVPDASSEPYWSAASEGHLVLPRCSQCQTSVFPPAPVCPHCGTTEPRYSYARVSGTGKIRSWTVVRDSFLPGFGTEIPYVLVDVQLDSEPHIRMIGRLLDGPDVELHVDARVGLGFETLDDDVAVPAFVLEPV